MQELLKHLTALQARIVEAERKIDIARDEAEIAELTAATLRPDFWSDSLAATASSRRLASLQKHVAAWRALETQTKDAIELGELGDDALTGEIERIYQEALANFESRNFELKLSGPHDRGSAILEIHAGTGGTDAQDWAQMLQRMYLRWAERAGFSAEIDSLSPGEEAGIKSVTIDIDGPYAYGKLQGESGVHRLVRLSPFNSDNLRQTSFALVEVLPKLEPTAELMIDPKDLRIDVYRAGGHGGQSVNTTDSAVRITHLPTGTVVAIQNERSQLQNKEKAMAVLNARLTALMESNHKAELTDLRSSDKSAEWGSQIRSYVLHPYTKVKDHRTGAETSQASDVLDGDLDLFLESYLESQVGTG